MRKNYLYKLWRFVSILPLPIICVNFTLNKSQNPQINSVQKYDFVHNNQFSSRIISKIFIDSKQNTWISSNNFPNKNSSKLWMRKNNQLNFIAMMQNNLTYISDIKEFDGGIWITGHDIDYNWKIYRTNSKNYISNQTHNLNEQFSFNCLTVFNKKLYIGCANQVYCLDYNEWQLCESFSSNITFLTSIDNKLWIGLDDSIIFCKNSSDSCVKLNFPLNYGAINKIINDKRGWIWVLTDVGVFYTKNSLKFIIILNDQFGGTDAAIDVQGNLFIAMTGANTNIFATKDGINFNKISDLNDCGILAFNVKGKLLFGPAGYTIHGLWIGTNIGYIYDFPKNSFHFIKTINGIVNVFSSSQIYFRVTNPVNEIVIDGKKYSFSKYNPLKYTFDCKNHTYNVQIIYKNKTKNLLFTIKNTLNINSKNFSTDSGYILNQYQGYINNDETKNVSVVYVTGEIGQPLLKINLDKFDETIDYDRTTLWLLDSNFKQINKPQKLTPNENTFQNSGLYLLHIFDHLGNLKNYYLQIGGNKPKIPNTFNINDNFYVSTGGIIEKNKIINNIKYDYVSNQDIIYHNYDKNISKITIQRDNNNEKIFSSNLNDFTYKLSPSDNKNISTFIINDYSSTKLIDKYRVLIIKHNEETQIRKILQLNSTLLSEFYIGVYKNQDVNVVSYLDNKDISPKKIILDFTSQYINFNGKSYYQKIINDAQIFSINKIVTEKTTIYGNGLFKIFIQNVLNFSTTVYLQIGGKTLIIMHKFTQEYQMTNAIFIKLKPKSFKTWEVVIIVLGPVIVMLLLFWLFIRLFTHKPEKEKLLKTTSFNNDNNCIFPDKQFSKKKNTSK